MSINSKVDICNMALSHLGNYGTVNNIDTPAPGLEATFALWYDIARQDLLKKVIPNFALERRVVAQLAITPVFGWGHAYEYPNDCLKLLGVGETQDKLNDNAVEGGVIYSDNDYTDGMDIRFVKDVKDVNSFSPEFKVLLSWYLASLVAMPITQDLKKKELIERLLPGKMSELSGINAQENRPIRISNSRFKMARFTNFPSFTNKK